MKPGRATLGIVLTATLLAGQADGQTENDIVIDEQTFTHFIPAPHLGNVVVHMETGELIVRGWSRDQIRVQGVLGTATVGIEMSQAEDQTLINVVPKQTAPELPAHQNIDLVVNMPRDSSLTFSSTDAEALITGVYGRQSLSTISGDIEAEVWLGSVTAESASGDLTVSNYTGFGPAKSGLDAKTYQDLIERRGVSSAILSTLSGDIEARGPFEHMTASTFSGDIDVDVADVSTLYLDTSNGDIQVQADLLAGADVSAETMNGDVSMDVGTGQNLTLDLGSYGGRIENCHGYEDSQTDAGTGRELRITGPEESPRLRVRTLNGNIELCSS